MKRRKSFWGLIPAVAVMLLFALPRGFNYQGKLVDSFGVGVNDTLPMVFRLYTCETGGSPVYEQTIPDVIVRQGLFSVELSGFPDSVDFSNQYWLELEINHEIFSPREKISAAPYSIRSYTVERAIQGIRRRGSSTTHTGTLVLAEGRGVSLSEEGDSIFLFFSSEGAGGGGGETGFSFSNPFNIGCYPQSIDLIPGLSRQIVVSASIVDTAFHDSVHFSVAGLPEGATFTFNPPYCRPTCRTKLEIQTTEDTPDGLYLVTVFGRSGAFVANGRFNMTVHYETYQWAQTTTAQFDENTNVNVQTTGDMVWLGMLDLGTGEDGDFHATSNMTLNAGTYNFRTFRIDPGVTVSVQRNTPTPLVIKCLGEAVISGWLDLSGENGSSSSSCAGTTGGLGGAGGYSGGNGGSCGSNGANGSGPGYGRGGTGNSGSYAYGGGGAGHATNGESGSYGIPGGSSYGNPQLTTLYGGSGGGGGGGGQSYGGGSGGGGGGALLFTAQKITINTGGGINANGGNGGYGTGYLGGGGGGGGSGGSIWLRAEKIINTGSITANGGSSSAYGYRGGYGSYGRIRMDCVLYAKSHPFYSDGTISPNVGWSEMPNTYLPSGQTTTYIIAPTGIRRWGILYYTRDVSMSGTSVKVDILNDTGDLLLEDVPSGTDLDLAGISATSHPAIRLRATLTTSNTSYSPKLLDWTLTYEANP